MKKILFLGYSRNKTSLIDFIESKKKSKVVNINKKITSKIIRRFDAVFCFGYRYIIDKETISSFNKPIINLHIGYLPYNRGAHPNFWAFAENTPSGVTIHEINEKIDCGNIIYQEQVDFQLNKNQKNLTFLNTYEYLINRIEKLFIENYDNLINYKYKSFAPIGRGSFHMKKDLPLIIKNWKQNIYRTVIKYDKNQKLLIERNLKILDQIENTRKNNNINWMNIVRTSMKNSSKDTLEILKNINNDDNKISELFKKLVK